MTEMSQNPPETCPDVGRRRGKRDAADTHQVRVHPCAKSQAGLMRASLSTPESTATRVL